MLDHPVQISLNVSFTAESNCEIIRKVEDVFDEVAGQSAGELGVPGASYHEDGAGIETFCCSFCEIEGAMHFAEEVSRRTKRFFRGKGLQFWLRRCEELDSGIKTFRKRLESGKKTRWIVESTKVGTKLRKTKIPLAFRHLQPFIERYYLAGGKDSYAIFSERELLDAFQSSLSTSNRRKLEAVYSDIVSTGIHRDINAWVADPVIGDQQDEKDAAGYFLGFLDALVFNGVISPERHPDGETLVDWSLFL